ncbi:nuclear transport factor 2 family protein [Streptomyces sp. ITFR-16]|uniref:ester cyclase n=1 Tax=Streptomyces sp. ITFR-16 TaxID=3075198 RepID=UPI00288A3B6B|nr:nuclear transport factor 2 family protein [Streptomyces sp. ITFR-16]WNI27164.1 nuclear transport factor 2 family protein [Streptomyces sp. ITFR-16]
MESILIPDWILQYVEACNRHDAVAVVDLMAEDVRVVDTAFGGEFKGREAVQQLLVRMDANLSSDYRFTVHKAVTSGDDYAFEWTLSGTNDRTNPELGLPATGNKFTVPGLTIGSRRDGEITENRDYWNVAGFLMQVGLMPPLGKNG